MQESKSAEATITRKKTVTPTTIAGQIVPNVGTGTFAMIDQEVVAIWKPD
jgi:hypothetical protein